MFELVLRAPDTLVEDLSDALVDELDAQSVTVEDADAGTTHEQAMFGEPGGPAPASGWHRSTLRALFDSEGAAEAAAAVLLAQPWAHGDGATPGMHVLGLQAVPEQDWVRLTQSQFAPVAVTPTFWIVPSWHEPPAEARQVIRLDPGLAFGTGTHATTRMCLRWLARAADAGSGTWPRVLDYGCGSGILAIAAAKLGAARVEAVDIDPAAVQSTHDNARHNGVAVHVRLPEEGDHGRDETGYSLVLANILATPLRLLAPLLGAQVAPGGWLILAGILDRQAGDLRQAYAPHVPIDVLDSEEGWILMGGRRAVDRLPPRACPDAASDR